MTNSPADAPAPYRVLARKYRPATFADLVGQEAMVRTLKNAFAADRIAQAFILTGIRGTGKTTTARIVAKGLNCVGPDGAGGPTTDPCGLCEPCRAIAEGRHVDVMEMDGASQTGVDNIRDNIIGSVQYAPTSARYKIYIIDEVHMLSAGSFNALLKTLEEPPGHVKFIFATTEIRKVPVTVLSRCQRFDLRRIEPEAMIALLARIAKAEGATVEDGALALIARAADGSARDATSLLDQAIAHGGAADAGVSAAAVRAMLGLADRGRVLDLFDLVMSGDAAGALGELGSQYAGGVDPLALMRDLAEVTHWVSVVKITPGAADDPTVGPDEHSRGLSMAEQLPMRVLTRTWQMLLKALEEVAAAPSPVMAAEMAIIRLTHVAELPSPEELVRRLSDAPAAQGTAPASPAPAAASAPGPGPAGAVDHAGPPPVPAGPRAVAGGGGAVAALRMATVGRSGAAAAPAMSMPVGDDIPERAQGPTPKTALHRYQTFDSVMALVRANRDLHLQIEIEEHLHLARYTPGRIEFRPGPQAPRDLAQRLARRLQTWTGARWTVSLVSEGGAPTIAQARADAKGRLEAAALAHPMMQAVMQAFPGARITEVRTPEAVAEVAAATALPEVPDEWDPFEDG